MRNTTRFAKVTAGLLGLFFSGCAAGDDAPASPATAGEAPLSVRPGNEAVPIRGARSLLVTNPTAFAGVADNNRHSMGALLEDFAKYATGPLARDSQNKPKFDKASDFIQHAFETTIEDHREHDRAPKRAQLGIVANENPYERILSLWPSLKNGRVGNGPFRLLAIVNRMDLAGDIDIRSTVDAGKNPKPMGEGRLVFGLVDGDYEKKKGDAYPMTFIVEYRLPALDANFDVQKNYDYRAAAQDPARYRVQLERWGKVWRELSRWDVDVAAERDAYQRHLTQIVDRFAQAENFLGIRANTRLASADREVEFELREWYLLNQSWSLIKRKPRDEPYKCVSAGRDMGKLVDSFWVPESRDVEMRALNANGKEISFNVPRSTIDHNLPLSDPFDGCPTDSKGKAIPYGMEGDDGQFNQNRRMVTAPFGRVGKDDFWRLPGATEDQRHAFAIRTCSGCHGQEAGVFGFHIQPRLDGKASRISDFLAGGGRTKLPNGSVYTYDALADRAKFLTRASEGDPTLAMYDGLWRNDRPE